MLSIWWFSSFPKEILQTALEFFKKSSKSQRNSNRNKTGFIYKSEGKINKLLSCGARQSHVIKHLQMLHHFAQPHATSVSTYLKLWIVFSSFKIFFFSKLQKIVFLKNMEIPERWVFLPSNILQWLHWLRPFDLKNEEWITLCIAEEESRNFYLLYY